MFTRTFTFSLSILVSIVKVLGRAYKSRVLSFTDSTVSINFDADELLKIALEDKNFDIYYHIVERNVQILELKENISNYTYYLLKVGDKCYHFVKLVNETYLNEERIDKGYHFHQTIMVNDHKLSHYCNDSRRNFIRSNNSDNNNWIVFYDTPKEFQLTIVNPHDSIINTEKFTEFSYANAVYSSYKGKSYSPKNPKLPMKSKKRRLMFTDYDGSLLKIKYLD